MSTPAQAAASRVNGSQSHGPATEEGKSRSCMNRFQHGFCGTFTVLPSEDQDQFETLLDALRMEHQPVTPTEALLVDKMAEHYWLSQRAQILQDLSMDGDAPSNEKEKSFALYIRYQTANDRGFSKCLHDLLKLRAERRKLIADREKQQQRQAEEQRKQEAHEARVRTVNAKAEFQELENSIKETIQARLPGHTEISFTMLKHVLGNAIEQFAKELDANPELAKILKAA